MNQTKNILFLSYELAGYYVAGIKSLVKNHDVSAHVVRYPVNVVAPFKFEIFDNVKFYEREQLDETQLMKLVKKTNPSIIICSGWKDKLYLKICKSYYGTINTVLTFDNPWTGSIKQIIYSLIAPFYFKKIFSHVWIPGEEHKKFARKLGFKNSEILLGVYSADFHLFHKEYLKNRSAKQNNFPHRILYVGRYTSLKGVEEMWQAFVEWQTENENDWELWCLGKGELENKFPKHEKIKNFGFVQPNEISKFIAQCGVFILPSRIEHWGVVIHEYAAAGFPLISNKNTASANFFLKNKHNGFVHQAHSKESIKDVFNLLLECSDSELFEMGENSVSMAKNITPEFWANTLMNIVK